MRIISLWQPWASAISLGLKQFETRSWSTNYSGLLAIHAAKRSCKAPELDALHKRMTKCGKEDEFAKLKGVIDDSSVYGAIVAVVSLKGCFELTSSHP